jgi:hypothetical protein
MIVTLTGGFRNAGDHLIISRAHRLLREYVDADILNFNRDDISAKSYATLNRARAVILCGGPAYQRNMYPGVYPLDLGRLDSTVIPLGLGWKGKLYEQPEDFVFSGESENFIKAIHSNIETSSCRDHLTIEVLSKLGIVNVQMTGCPAWYDLDNMEREFEISSPSSIVFSDPAHFSQGSFAVMRSLKRRFPRAQLTLALHHGYYSKLNRRGLGFGLNHLLLTSYAKSLGFRICNIAADLAAMQDVYNSCDLHIGYRVHAHIYCLARRTASLLISEDSRGIGQSCALGCSVLQSDDRLLVDQLHAQIDQMLDRREGYFLQTMQAMHSGFDTMKGFLHSIEKEPKRDVWIRQ